MLVTAFASNQYQVAVSGDPVQLVPANTSRVTLIVSNGTDKTVWINPTVPSSSGTGLELGPAASGYSTEKLYYHNVGSLVGEGWYVVSDEAATGTVTVIEVLYRPE